MIIVNQRSPDIYGIQKPKRGGAEKEKEKNNVKKIQQKKTMKILWYFIHKKGMKTFNGD